MIYVFIDGKQRCKNCGAEPSSPDRHACYWEELESSPIGHVASVLAGQFTTFDAMEKRVARGIWRRVKQRDAPKSVKHIDLINASNLEVYQAWVKRGDEACAS